MDGLQYEYVCASILRSRGFKNVKVTKASGDQGIDVIAYKHGLKYGIQCKYYSHPVGNFAVQEAFTGAKIYNCDYAAVMTNTTFTGSAKEAAAKTGVILWENQTKVSHLGSFVNLILGEKPSIRLFLNILGVLFILFGVLCLFANKEPEDTTFAIVLFMVSALCGVCCLMSKYRAANLIYIIIGSLISLLMFFAFIPLGIAILLSVILTVFLFRRQSVKPDESQGEVLQEVKEEPVEETPVNGKQDIFVESTAEVPQNQEEYHSEADPDVDPDSFKGILWTTRSR